MKNGAAYSHEQKIAIIQEHTEHHRTLKEICEEYGISKSYLCYLLKQYREKGRKGIAATKYYSEEFKLSVVKRHYEEGEPFPGKRTRKYPKNRNESLIFCGMLVHAA